ncbi:hypothetical protein ACLI4Z_09225 [Natrialbaceae archaeon A-arb3/5]
MISDLLLPTTVAGVVSFLVALGTAEYRLRREQTVETKKQVQSWYAETAQLASNVRILWKNEYEEKTNGDGMIQYDEIKRQMKLRGRQINGHIGESKSVEVDQDVVDELEELGRLCSSLSDVLTRMGTNEDFRERGREIIDQAEKVEELSLAELSEEP